MKSLGSWVIHFSRESDNHVLCLCLTLHYQQHLRSLIFTAHAACSAMMAFTVMANFSELGQKLLLYDASKLQIDHNSQQPS